MKSEVSLKPIVERVPQIGRPGSEVAATDGGGGIQEAAPASLAGIGALRMAQTAYIAS